MDVTSKGKMKRTLRRHSNKKKEIEMLESSMGSNVSMAGMTGVISEIDATDDYVMQNPMVDPTGSG